MLRTLLVRGMVVGIVAGLLGFGTAKIFGEPQVDRAIAFETQMDEAKKAAEAPKQGDDGQPAKSAANASAANADGANGISGATNMPAMAMNDGDEELVSRGMQSTFGLLTAVLVYGTAFGGIFALVYAYAWGRVRGISSRGLSALLALGAFIAIILVPGLKYPANPPSVGLPETITIRTELYLGMIIISVAALIGAIQVFRSLIKKHGIWTAVLWAGAGYVLIIIIAQLILPPIQEVPEGFPAVVLWNFRIAHWGIQAVLWATMGLVFGYLTERSLRNSSAVQR